MYIPCPKCGKNTVDDSDDGCKCKEPYGRIEGIHSEVEQAIILDIKKDLAKLQKDYLNSLS